MGISVIFPARNEHASLTVIIPFLFAASISAGEVIVVVDTLEDDTWKLSKVKYQDSRKVRLILNEGIGVLGAIQTGVRYSHFEYSIICAADEYLPIASIDSFFASLESGFDFVSGTRYSKGGKRYGGSMVGKSISWIANALLRLKFRNGMTDFTTGIKAFKNSVFSQLLVGSNSIGWSCSLTFALNAHRTNLLMCEIPIISVDRVLGGSSTFQVRKWLFGYLYAIKNFITWKSVRND